MKKRPLVVRIVALAFFLSPLFIISQLLMLYNIPFEQCLYVFTPQIWSWQIILVMISTPLVGFAVWSVRRWGYIVLLVYAGLMLTNNIILYVSNLAASSLAQRLLLNAGIIALILVFQRKEVNAPYFNPNLRWWEQAKRFIAPPLRVFVKTFGKNEVLFEAASFDISETGIFIASDRSVTVGDVFGIDIDVTTDLTIHASGEVVWVHNSADKLPKGFGFKFLAVDRAFRIHLKTSLRELQAHMRKRG